MNDSIYLFDAAQHGSAGGICTSSFIWKASLGTPTTFGGNAATNFAGINVGCEATPVIDSGIIYAVCNDNSSWKFNALHLSDGSAIFAASTVAGSSNSRTFAASNQNCRPGLLFLSGHVYAAFSAFVEGTSPFNGWVFGFNASTGAVDYSWSDTSAALGWAGIWMTGGGISTDGTSLYVSTGNGTCNSGDTNYAEAVVKLSTTLTVQDFWNSSTCGTESTADQDFSTAVVVFGSLVVAGDKAGNVNVLNQSSLGGNGGMPEQAWTVTGAEIISGLVLTNSNLYTAGHNANSIARYTFSAGTFNTTPAAVINLNVTTYYTGPMMSYSSNGAASGIVWATRATNLGDPGTLYALDGTSLAILWSSSVLSDSLPVLPKYTHMTIANGQVFVPTFSNKVMVYGLAVPASQSSQVQGRTGLSGKVTIQ